MTGRVRAVVQEAVARVPFELAVLGESPPMITAENAPILRLLAGELGQTEYGSASFGTDGGWLSRLGLDCVIWGPGSIEVAHKPDEYLPKSDFTAARGLLARTIERFCLGGE